MKRIRIAASVSSKCTAAVAEMGRTATSMRRAARMTVQDGIGNRFSWVLGFFGWERGEPTSRAEKLRR
jgi:hypothetical protein